MMEVIFCVTVAAIIVFIVCAAVFMKTGSDVYSRIGIVAFGIAWAGGIILGLWWTNEIIKIFMYGGLG